MYKIVIILSFFIIYILDQMWYNDFEVMKYGKISSVSGIGTAF